MQHQNPVIYIVRDIDSRHCCWVVWMSAYVVGDSHGRFTMFTVWALWGWVTMIQAFNLMRDSSEMFLVTRVRATRKAALLARGAGLAV